MAKPSGALLLFLACLLQVLRQTNRIRQPKVAELVGGIDSLRNNASTDEGASMLKGHPEVNAPVDWGREPTIVPSKLQLGRNSWVFSNGEFSEKRRIEY